MKQQRLITALLASLLATPTLAGFDEGLAAYNKDNYAQALKEWKLLAEQGDARAQSNLGLMYSMGQGVPKDFVWPICCLTSAPPLAMKMAAKAGK